MPSSELILGKTLIHSHVYVCCYQVLRLIWRAILLKMVSYDKYRTSRLGDLDINKARMSNTSACQGNCQVRLVYSSSISPTREVLCKYHQFHSDVFAVQNTEYTGWFSDSPEIHFIKFHLHVAAITSKQNACIDGLIIWIIHPVLKLLI